MRTRVHWTILLAIAVATARAVAAPPPITDLHEQARPGLAPPGSVYACPMHADVTAATAGTCPRCGMTLSLMDPFDAREYLVHVATTPGLLRSGERFQLRLTVREPQSGAVVTQFGTVHDKRFHLFVLSQDLEHYAHVHPEQSPDGSWSLDMDLPRPGYYKLYADFLPAGGTPQVVALPLVTAGFRGGLASSSASLVADRELMRVAGDMRVELVLPDGPLVAGRDETFAFHLSDLKTGAPVLDIESYLAAWGHTLLVSEDTLAVVHAHPVELVPEGDPNARGGPVITFKALFPKAGMYRLWTQMQRHGQVVTASFTVAVRSPVQ